ncbi:hypothetical protein [Flavobacterium poyangense]|uniref:hypothetical protein n=1 Tax=Flavobacterium poyangense TaxID=2204302 RepID=UPI00141DE536|nr:hypothetical protein [Flavobacterium sp. JXAS1]
MKKLILTAAIVFGTLSVQAGTTFIKTTKVQLETTQDGYKEVDAVPAFIKAAVDKAYPGVKIEKAYINDKKEYKLDIIVRDVKSTVFTDEQGIIMK